MCFLIFAILPMGCSFFAESHILSLIPYHKKVDTHTFVSVYFHFTGAKVFRCSALTFLFS